LDENLNWWLSTLNFNYQWSYLQSPEWDAKNILTTYSYIPFSSPFKSPYGTFSVGVIGGWSPISTPLFGLLYPLNFKF
jgi:hypothetical protein